MIIANRPIGSDHAPFVIAELGLNHSGRLDIAASMVRAAKRAGADAVKLQSHADDEFSDVPAYPGNAGGESIQAFVHRCSLSDADECAVFDYARGLDIICLSTPFSPKAVERLELLQVPAYKVGSGQVRDLALLRLIRATRKPVIMSTGMSDESVICQATTVLGGETENDSNHTPYALLHCTSEYPTPMDHVRLGVLGKFPYEKLYGLSDHTGTIWPLLGAVALGASILEVHFRIDACHPGPDLCVSVDERQLTDLVTGSRAIWEARGGEKIVLPGEAETLKWFTASRRAV